MKQKTRSGTMFVGKSVSAAVANLAAELRAISEAQAIAEFTVEGMIISANDKFLAAFGYSLREVTGRHHSVLLPPEERNSPAYAAFWSSLRSGEYQAGEVRRVGKRGREVWLQASYTPVLDTNGKPLKIVKVATDVTAQKRLAVRHLGEVRAIRRAHAVIEFAIDGTILSANAKFLSALGYSLGELKGKHHRMLVVPAERDGEAYRAFWARLAAGHYCTGEFRRIGKGGREVWLLASYNPVMGADGQPIRIVKVATDITAEKLRAADHRSQIEAIGRAQAVAVFAMDGRILTANDRFLAAFGYRLADIRGKAHAILVAPADRESGAYRGFWDALRAGQFQAGTFRRIGRDGREVWLQASYNPILDSDGRPVKVVKVASDVTEERRAISHQIDQLKTIAQVHAVIEYAIDGTIIAANEKALMLTGYTLDEIVGRHHGILLDPAERDSAAYRAFWAAIAAGQQQAVDMRRVTKTGGTLWLQAVYNPVVGIDGKVIKVVAVATDVTAEKLQSADHLSQIEAIHRSQAVIEFAMDGTILTANDKFLAAMGYTLSEIVGRHHSIFVTPEDQASEEYRAFWASLQSGQYRSGEYRRLGKDGREVWIQASYNPILDIDGHPTKIVKFATDVTVQKRLAAAVDHDTLTGLPNRMLMSDRIAQAIMLAHRHGGRMAVMFLDLDRFKHINDSLGHAVGDALLQSVAQRLLDCVRGSDTVSRLGGDEFVVVLAEIRDPEDAAITAKRMLSELARAHLVLNNEIHVTTSIGISVYPDDGTDRDALIRNADTAMYQAKEGGRQGYKFFRPAMNARAMERQSLEEGLRHALDRGEFSLLYQPKIDMRTGAIAGAEALLRWNHPTRGTIPPAQFIPIAEDCGLMLPIGAWVLRESCRQAKSWMEAGAPPLRVAVNVSALQFRQDRFSDLVRSILRETRLDADCLQLELTESILMQRVDYAADVLQALREAGVHVAVDDFGTGYSSLSYLTTLAIDTLKVDRSFVHDLTGSARAAAVVVAVMAMARSFSLRVIAEGVETREEAAFLQSHQCDEAQGFYFSGPLPPLEFARLRRGGQPLGGMRPEPAFTLGTQTGRA